MTLREDPFVISLFIITSHPQIILQQVSNNHSNIPRREGNCLRGTGKHFRSSKRNETLPFPGRKWSHPSPSSAIYHQQRVIETFSCFLCGKRVSIGRYQWLIERWNWRILVPWRVMYFIRNLKPEKNSNKTFEYNLTFHDIMTFIQK